MLIMFFDADGIVHPEYAPQNQTVNKEFYLDVMRRLREAVRRKRPEEACYQSELPAETSIVLETTTTTSNTILSTPQEATNFKNSQEKRPNRNIALKTEIQMTPHKTKKSTPLLDTSDEDMVVYDFDEEEVKIDTRSWLTPTSENVSQAAEIVNGVYGADTVTASYVQFWFRRFRSGIFEVKFAPRTGRPVVENVDKITEIIQVDQHVSSRSITQELKIDHKKF
ncbi:histone-lysine N-methyltransferase SETMAR [Trichonephila clavipes]|nr:histone-lysine N-methyltransferase SETMAR [Trichonephila clavipes]